MIALGWIRFRVDLSGGVIKIEKKISIDPNKAEKEIVGRFYVIATDLTLKNCFVSSHPPSENSATIIVEAVVKTLR